MSGSMSVVVSGGGGDAYMAPFTAVQWQELEHQALIYKYLVAGVPVPSDLVLPIRRSLEALSARLLNHHALGYCSYYHGKKFDPEPGRCRRTDGKKWRCSKDAYHESKYCERHMNRGRNRSRKPVETQSTSHSLSTDITVNTKGSYQNVSSARSSSQSLYSVTNSGSYNFGNNGSKLQVDAVPYGINNKDLRYAQGLTVNVDNQNYTSGVQENLSGLGMDSDLDNSWRLMPSQLVSNSLSKPQNDSYLQSNSNTFEPMIDANSISSKQSQQHHCFFGSEIDQVKHEQSSMLPWSRAKETWSSLDATTQLSISMVDPKFDARNASPINGAFS